MKNRVEIEIVLDEQYADPHVTIRTGTNTQQVENIIRAIENATDSDCPKIAVMVDGSLIFVSQKDIVRICMRERKVILMTEDAEYTVRYTLAGLEDMLDPASFLRISQSEIINLCKVKRFDLDKSGIIGVEFECGMKSWVSRSRVKQIKEMLKQSSIPGV